MIDFYFVAYIILKQDGTIETHGDSIMEIGASKFIDLGDDIRKRLSEKHDDKMVVLTSLSRVS